MSVLGHMMESRGFATVALGLVRYQIEQVRPPRGLWTPFQLGRPLGEPEDRAFQRRVLMHALGLLERTDGPVILEDFPDDPPGWTDREGWVPPFTNPEAGDPEAGALAQSFGAELVRLGPFWAAAKMRFGRTTVGVSGQVPDKWPDYIARALRGEIGGVPPHASGAWSLRYLADDIRAMYSESAHSAGPAPASRQIDGWFWRSTVAGRVLIALRSMAMASSDETLKRIGTRFMVPAIYVPKG